MYKLTTDSPESTAPEVCKSLDELAREGARRMIAEALEDFRQEFEAGCPRAVVGDMAKPECLQKDEKQLLTLFDFPAEHWQHLRTTNPIESPFAAVKGRLRKTKGAGSRTACLAMAFDLALAAQEHWRRVNAPHLVTLVRAGVPFRDGLQVDSHHTATEEQPLEEAVRDIAASSIHSI